MMLLLTFNEKNRFFKQEKREKGRKSGIVYLSLPHEQSEHPHKLPSDSAWSEVTSQ